MDCITFLYFRELIPIYRKLFVIVAMMFSIFVSAVESQASPNAEDELRVVALFNNAAMVQYKGKQKLLRKGQQLNSDIKLISANTRQAEFLIAGKRVSKNLQSLGQFSENSVHATPADKTVRILRSADGMFKVNGSINNVPVHFLVDTGATFVAMNETVASQLRILYKVHGKKSYANTAAGTVIAWQVVLENVGVGSIRLSNVPAVVISGAGPNEVLLGNSFLSRLKIEHDNRIMVLTRRY